MKSNQEKKELFTVRLIVEDALFAALAMALNYIKPDMEILNISFGFIPIAFLALKRGLLNGMVSGLIFGILDLFLKGMGTPNVVSVIQALFEYIVAFTLIGLAGLAHGPLQLAINKKQHGFAVLSLFLGTLIGSLGKFACHTIASATFFSKYLTIPKHGNVWIAALLYQAPSFFTTFILAAFCLILIYAIRPTLYEG